MDFKIVKDRLGLALINGNTAHIVVNYLPSLNHLERVQDVGIEIVVNKKSYHGSLAPMVAKLFKEAESEAKALATQFSGKHISLFNNR